MVAVEGSSRMRGVARLSLTLLMNLLLLTAAALLGRIILTFFGALASLDLARAYASFSAWLVYPFGFSRLATPYHGTFEVDAALTLLTLLGVEWALAVLRRSST